MRILVIGRSGQVARSLLEAAVSVPNLKVVAVGRPEVELGTPRTLAAAVARHAPDLVINAAAYTAVDAAESDADTAFRHNAQAPEVLARACAREDVPLVHLSTDYVFDGTAGRPYREDDLPTPLGIYGRSKGAGEAAVAAALDRCLIVRTAWVHSPFGRNFTKTMLRLGNERDRLGVVADQRGCPTYAPHLAEFLLLASCRAISPAPPVWGIYHAVGAGDTTWHGFAEAIFEAAAAAGRPRPRVEAIATVDYPTPAPRPADSRLDTAKIQATFGATLPSWRSGVSAAVTALLRPSPSRA